MIIFILDVRKQKWVVFIVALLIELEAQIL